jgi:hypothetical protein
MVLEIWPTIPSLGLSTLGADILIKGWWFEVLVKSGRCVCDDEGRRSKMETKGGGSSYTCIVVLVPLRTCNTAGIPQ